ncbi:MAG: P-loop NTPase fold protein [Luteibacter sp.]
MTQDSRAMPAGYRFIKDTPADTDAFGPHARVSKAMVQSLNANPDLQTVALVGPWGSGKSTVLRLFGAALDAGSAAPDSTIYTFDAWVHHGEPMQRAFLEDFSRFCARRKPKAKRSIKSAVDLVTGRATVTDTFDEPRISWGGLAVLAAVALAVFALAQGSRLMRLPFAKSALSAFPPWLPVTLPLLMPVVTVAVVALSRLGERLRVGRLTRFVLAGGVVSLPVLLGCTTANWHAAAVGGVVGTCGVVAVVAVCIVSARRVKRDGRLATQSTPDATDSLLGLLLNRQHQSRRTHVTGRPSPSAMDFSATFHELLALTFVPAARLVLVVDNLDRLAPSEARDVWAMLRTFFYSPPDAEQPKQRPPVVVVPVAEETLSALHGDAAASFVDKTFDITFYLPPPVLVRWQEYLHDRMREVFGAGMDPDWPHQVAHLTDAAIAARAAQRAERAKAVTADERITPRQLNTLVNQIASYWLQYGSEDTVFASVAYYCIHKEEFDRNVLGAVAGARVPVDVYDPAWQETTAALHFGVARVDALPVLLTPPLERALTERDADVFQNLMRVTGSEAILLRVLERHRGAKGDVAAVPFNAIAVLDGAERRGQRIPPVVWQMLVDIIAVSDAPWDPLSRRSVDDLIALMDRPAARERSLLAAINRRQHNVRTPPADPDAQVALWRYAEEHYPDDVSSLRSIMVAGTPSTVISVACQLDDLPILGRLTSQDGDGVLKTLMTDLTRAVSPQEAMRRLLAIRRTRIAVAWPTHFEAAVEVLNGGVGPTLTRESVNRLSTPVLSIIVVGMTDDQTRAAARATINARGASMAQYGIRTGAIIVTGLVLAAYVVQEMPLPGLPDSPADADWDALIDAFVLGLDAAGVLETTDLGAVVVPPKRAAAEFDYPRLLSGTQIRVDGRLASSGKPRPQRISLSPSSA